MDTARGLRRLSRPCPSRSAMLPFMQPGEIDRAIAGAAERKRAREAAARMMGFASYAAYHLQRGITRDGASATLPRNPGGSQSAIRKAGASSSASRRSPSWEAGGSGHACGSDQIDGGPPAQIERLPFTSTAAMSDHGTLATRPP
jgi:hypothetical protein